MSRRICLSVCLCLTPFLYLSVRICAYNYVVRCHSLSSTRVFSVSFVCSWTHCFSHCLCVCLCSCPALCMCVSLSLALHGLICACYWNEIEGFLLYAEPSMMRGRCKLYPGVTEGFAAWPPLWLWDYRTVPEAYRYTDTQTDRDILSGIERYTEWEYWNTVKTDKIKGREAQRQRDRNRETKMARERQEMTEREREKIQREK